MGEYRIGEFAKKLCVTQDLLKHYERYDILSSRKKGAGGYRYYDFCQSPQILFSKQLQNWEFSLKEISLMMKGLSPEESSNLLVKQLKMLKRKNQELHWQIRYLEELCGILERVRSGRFHGEWAVRESGKYLFFPHSCGFDFLKMDKNHRSLQCWINLQGITIQGALISGCRSGSPQLTHGFFVPLEAGENLGLDKQGCLTCFGGDKSFIFSSSLSDDEGISSSQFIDKILEDPRHISRKHNLNFSNQTFVFTYFLTKEENRIFRHRKLIFPME